MENKQTQPVMLNGLTEAETTATASVMGIAKATQPAEVTDERQAFEKWLGIRPCGAAHDLAWSAWKARAILSLRPVQVPMTDEQVDAFTVNGRLHWLGKRQLIRAVEAYYGITAQAKKEPS